MGSGDVGVALFVDEAGAEEALPVLHGKDPSNGSSVISVWRGGVSKLHLLRPGASRSDEENIPEKYTTKGDEEAHSNGGP